LLDPNFENLINGIKSQFTKIEDIRQFEKYYTKGILFLKLRNLFPNDRFFSQRFDLIGRNLAFSIFLAIHHVYEEAEYLLRQILDLVYAILYGANHILEINTFEEFGIYELAGNLRSDVEKILNKQKAIKNKYKSLYPKLSNIVHGTYNNILSNIKSINESWEDQSKLASWKEKYLQTIDYSAVLIVLWMKNKYDSLDLVTKSRFDNEFSSLKLIN
jgi:hypothetical protein